MTDRLAEIAQPTTGYLVQEVGPWECAYCSVMFEGTDSGERGAAHYRAHHQADADAGRIQPRPFFRDRQRLLSEVSRLQQAVESLTQGQQALQAQTVRIRRALGVEAGTEGDTEDHARRLYAELSALRSAPPSQVAYTCCNPGDCPLHDRLAGKPSAPPLGIPKEPSEEAISAFATGGWSISRSAIKNGLRAAYRAQFGPQT